MRLATIAILVCLTPTICALQITMLAKKGAAEVFTDAVAGARADPADVEVGQEMQGTIRSVQAYGAFVDVGAATDGLLHVSEISNEFIKDATEKLNVGDTITVAVAQGRSGSVALWTRCGKAAA